MIELESPAVHAVTSVNVVAGSAAKVRYPFLVGRSRVLPRGLAAIVISSDLQGRGLPSWDPVRGPPLVGALVAAEAARWLREDRGIDAAACGSWRRNVHLLDCGTVELDGLVFGGVGGCVGNPKQPFRFEARDQEIRLLEVRARQPDMLIVHQGPVGHGRDRLGAALVEEVLRLAARPTLVFCGHEHWDPRTVDVGLCRVLNAHEAVCILGRLEDSVA